MIKTKSQIGKAGRAAGKLFENKVRAELEQMGFIVSKWNNNVDLQNNKLIPVRPKYNPFTKSLMMMSGGFPDYIVMKRLDNNFYEVVGVESKLGKYLDAEEKKKAQWLINNKIFSMIFVAYKKKEKGKRGGEIAYDLV